MMQKGINTAIREPLVANKVGAPSNTRGRWVFLNRTSKSNTRRASVVMGKTSPSVFDLSLKALTPQKKKNAETKTVVCKALSFQFPSEARHVHLIPGDRSKCQPTTSRRCSLGHMESQLMVPQWLISTNTKNKKRPPKLSLLTTCLHTWLQ